jgi:hypothetical protein
LKIYIKAACIHPPQRHLDGLVLTYMTFSSAIGYDILLVSHSLNNGLPDQRRCRCGS